MARRSKQSSVLPVLVGAGVIGGLAWWLLKPRTVPAPAPANGQLPVQPPAGTTPPVELPPAQPPIIPRPQPQPEPPAIPRPRPQPEPEGFVPPEDQTSELFQRWRSRFCDPGSPVLPAEVEELIRQFMSVPTADPQSVRELADELRGCGGFDAQVTMLERRANELQAALGNVTSTGQFYPRRGFHRGRTYAYHDPRYGRHPQPVMTSSDWRRRAYYSR